MTKYLRINKCLLSAKAAAKGFGRRKAPYIDEPL